jgi:hypothetical protein
VDDKSRVGRDPAAARGPFLWQGVANERKIFAGWYLPVRWLSVLERQAGRSMRLTPADERECLRNRVDLVVVANAGKAKQFDHELAQPWRVLPKMNQAGMELGGLRRKPHDLVTLERVVVVVGADSFPLEREWFEFEVRPRLKGRCTLIRFADDAVMAFEEFLDAKRVLGVLGKRLARYGLTLHPDKTRFVDFRNNRPNGTNHPETNGTSFTFLGFTHIWGKSRAGKNVVRQVTAKNRYARALAAVTAWCRINRHQSIPDQQAHLTAVMRGHYAYYGITGNSRRLSWYADQVVRIWQKWLSRRDRGSRLHWSQFTALLQRHPLPAARIVHRYTFVSEALP